MHILSEHEKNEELVKLGGELNSVQDLDMLMERILIRARRFTNADAGSFFLVKDDGRLTFDYTQNATLEARLQPGQTLEYSSFSLPVNSQSIAGHTALTAEHVNIADAYCLPPGTPYSFDSSFDAASNYRTTSILSLPLLNSMRQVFGVLQLINAQGEDGRIVPFGEVLAKQTEMFASIAATALERARMTRALILRMIRMAELRDPKETGAHVNRVGGYAAELYELWANAHGIPKREQDTQADLLRMAAMLHDVGKIAISDTILKKPGQLNEEEYAVMKTHALRGAQLFSGYQSPMDHAAAEIALTHHERWDGTGYPGHVDVVTGKPLEGHSDDAGNPRGKKGDEIPLFGRITAIADVYDALLSRRSYKQAWSEEKTLKELRAGAGTHFDPELVELFISGIDSVRGIAQRYPY